MPSLLRGTADDSEIACQGFPVRVKRREMPGNSTRPAPPQQDLRIVNAGRIVCITMRPAFTITDDSCSESGYGFLVAVRGLAAVVLCAGAVVAAGAAAGVVVVIAPLPAPVLVLPLSEAVPPVEGAGVAEGT
jgi:hypothetical protein